MVGEDIIIKQGSKVKFSYKGRFETGEIFDASAEGSPLEFEFGQGRIIPGLETQMEGMKRGDKKTIKVEAKDAYGEPKEELIKEIPKGPIPEGMKLEKGTIIYLKTADGTPFPATIAEVKEKTILLDLNHPLAGKRLIFDVEIVEVA